MLHTFYSTHVGNYRQQTHFHHSYDDSSFISGPLSIEIMPVQEVTHAFSYRVTIVYHQGMEWQENILERTYQDCDIPTASIRPRSSTQVCLNNLTQGIGLVRTPCGSIEQQISTCDQPGVIVETLDLSGTAQFQTLLRPLHGVFSIHLSRTPTGDGPRLSPIHLFVNINWQLRRRRPPIAYLSLKANVSGFIFHFSTISSNTMPFRRRRMVRKIAPWSGVPISFWSKVTFT